MPHRAIITSAAFVGITGDLLVHGSQAPGLNMPLFFMTLALAIGATTRCAGRPVSREARGWLLLGIVLAAALAVRASPALAALGFVSASAAFTFPALRAGSAWIRKSGVGDHIEALVGAAVASGFGALRVAADALSSTGADPTEDHTTPRPFGAALRGLLLAAPLLFVFGALFVSADRVFAGIVADWGGTAVDVWASHLAVAAILTWLATGYLAGFLSGTGMRGMIETRVRRPSIGIIEAGVALALVDLLFMAFVTVQFRTLFGGADLIEVTPGLTYAEYAREGFGQLALASALVLPSLLAVDWLLGPVTRAGRWIFRALGGLQLLLLLVIMASAFQRVSAYQAAFGLTESRFYGAALLAWLTLVSAWFGWTVLRGRREAFASPALLSAFAAVLVLCLANPDAWIARTNLERAQPSIDADYLISLSADAVPTLLPALPALEPQARCRLAERLLKRWHEEGDSDWRSWNRAVARARAAVGAEADELRRLTARGCDLRDRTSN